MNCILHFVSNTIQVCQRTCSLQFTVEKEMFHEVITVKTKSELPIYEQIEQQMIDQILDGTIAENEQLPSIRQLARNLKISVTTTTRVYNDLSNEGFIISIVGKGYFVAPKNNDLLKERMLCEMEKGLEKAVISGRNAGLSDNKIITALTEYLKNIKKTERCCDT